MVAPSTLKTVEGGRTNSPHHSTIRATENVARQLLRRYGVVFRDVLTRESLVQSWRDPACAVSTHGDGREIRGGRFVNGFTGEQFALPEAVEALRTIRKIISPLERSTRSNSSHRPTEPRRGDSPGSSCPSGATNFLVFKDGALFRTDDRTAR